ncbi:MAG: ferrous iron transport protein A [Oscillospiraceae bacterium]|nr:ferrous iron transport protein A [Oscillospiraceae bacterium]
MEKSSCLSSLSVGEECCVSALLCDGGIRRRLLDIGLIPGTRVVCIGKSPLGDPTAYSVRGKTVALRAADAAKIII